MDEEHQTLSTEHPISSMSFRAYGWPPPELLSIVEMELTFFTLLISQTIIHPPTY